MRILNKNSAGLASALGLRPSAQMCLKLQNVVRLHVRLELRNELMAQARLAAPLEPPTSQLAGPFTPHVRIKRLQRHIFCRPWAW